VLDVFAPGIGAFLACGRLGCLISGCCHGKPSVVGIRYPGPTHDELAGIRLFPVQLVEAAWLAIITSIAALFVLLGTIAGTAFWFWLLSYAVGRFFLDFARGDVRARWISLTEAQWLCVLIVVARFAYDAILTGVASRASLFMTLALITVIFGCVTGRRWLNIRAPLLPTSSMSGWQTFLDLLERDARAARMSGEVRRVAPGASASIGLAIGVAPDDREIHSYALRGTTAPLDDYAAIALAGMLAQRLPAHSIVRAGVCNDGAFHYWAMVDPRGQAGSTVEDVPDLVRLRAQAFANLVRTAVALSDNELPRLDPPLPTLRPASVRTASTTAAASYFRRPV
jgi:hypothetical protein